MAGLVDIIGPDGKRHYTRPSDHPDVAEARGAQGYSVRPHGRPSRADHFPGFGRSRRGKVTRATCDACFGSGGGPGEALRCPRCDGKGDRWEVLRG